MSIDERVRESEVEAGREGQARTRTTRRTGRQRAVRALAPRLRLYQIGALVAVLALWEWLGRRSPTYTFAAPSEIVTAAVDMVESGELQAAIGDSLVALLLGFGLAVVVGTAIGYAFGWWRMLGRTLDPFVAALYVVPIAALIPVLIVWFGFGLSTTVLIIFLFAVFEPLIAAEAAVRGVDRGYVDVARTFGADTVQTARKVVLPATLPFVLPASRMAASRGVKGMVLAEMFVAVSGLGGIIIRSARSFRMDEVFVAVIVIALIGVLLTSAVGAVERYLLRWRA